MKKIITKEYLKNLTERELMDFIERNRFRLCGSAVFTRNDSFISKAVCAVTKNGCNKGFIPSHIGSIFLNGLDVKLFDMKPTKGVECFLRRYIITTKDDFVIVMRDFDIDTYKFSDEIKKYIGKKYGYISALQAGFKLLWFPLGVHCSEIHERLLQLCGWNVKTKPNNSTPESTYHLLTERETPC